MKNKIIRLLSDKKIRYLLIGGSSAFLEFGSFVVINHFSTNVVISNVLSFLVGLLYSFSLHRVWTFKGEHKHNPKRQFVSYGVLAIINIFLTSVLIGFQVTSLNIAPFFAKLVCMALVVVWNYLLLSRVIFKGAPENNDGYI